MSLIAAARAALPGPEGSGLRWALITLCVTEITSWGVLYYAFPVVATAITRSTGWPAATVTAAFSASQLVAAVAGVAVGRWLDRHGPRVVMTLGSVLAVSATAGVALAPSLWAFFLAWIAAGLSMAAVFYQPAFAALTRWFGDDRVRALTALTLVAGLASTVFAPLTGALVTRVGWRATYLILAAVLALITIPLHAVGLRPLWPAGQAIRRGAASHGDISGIVRSRQFGLLLTGMTLAAFAMYAVVVNLVPLLAARGIGTQVASVALGSGGVGQVLGRVAYARLVRRSGLRARTVAILLAGGLTTLLLGLLPGPAVLLAAGVVLAGMARGVFTLLQATAVSERWPERLYPRLSGILAMPLTTAIAVAPWAGAALAVPLGGYPALFAVLSGISLLGAVVAWGSTPEAASAGAR